MSLDSGISSLIGRIYASVCDSNAWENVLLDVRQRMDALCLMESVSDLRHQEMMRSTVYGSPRRSEGAQEFQEEIFSLDPSFRWATEHPHARFCDTSHTVPAEVYLEHEFIRWNRDKWIGSTHWYVGYTPPGSELTFGLSVHPPAEVGPLSEERKVLFRILFDHMENAIRLAARPPALVSLSQAVILLDHKGRIRQLSPAAETLLEKQDGLSMIGKSLRAADTNASIRLDAAIGSAIGALADGGCGGAVALPRPSGRRDLLVTVTPLVDPSSPFGAFGPAAFLRIVDPEARADDDACRRWSDLFGLTPAESRLTGALMDGDHGLRRTAGTLGIAYGTARVHLRNILDKTGTHNQSQLTRLLSRLE